MAEFLKLRMLTNQSLLACTVCGRFYLKSVFIEDLRQIWHNATSKTHRMLLSKLFKGFSDICWGHFVIDPVFQHRLELTVYDEPEQTILYSYSPTHIVN